MSTLFSGIVSDIYEYAKEYDADYYDIKNGYIIMFKSTIDSLDWVLKMQKSE